MPAGRMARGARMSILARRSRWLSPFTGRIYDRNRFLGHLVARSTYREESIYDYERRDHRSTKTPQTLSRPSPAHSVGNIVAHEAVDIERLRAFFRDANRRPALQEATALLSPLTGSREVPDVATANQIRSKRDVEPCVDAVHR